MEDENTKWCPLFTIASCSLPSPEGAKECHKEGCAWYYFSNDNGYQCAFVHLAQTLGYINKHIAYR